MVISFFSKGKNKTLISYLVINFVLIILIPKYSFATEPFGTNLGSFDGVIAHSNCSVYCTSCNNNCNFRSNLDGKDLGIKWQCVEYVNRYYYMKYGIDLRSLHSGDANTFYDNASKMHLNRYQNGGTKPPMVGDIIVSEGGDHGHVAVVKSVSSNEVCMIQQNFTNTYSDSNFCRHLSRSGGHYTLSSFKSNGGYPVKGWLRRIGGGGISVYDFYRHADPIYESNQDGHNNFDAQFKVRNDGSSSKTIDNMAIDLINQNGTRFAMWVKGSSTTLSPGGTYSTGIHDAELWYNGNWAVEARLQVDGEWATYVRKEFQVLDSDSGGSDPPGGGNGDADISIDKVEIKKTGESDSHFRHSFTVTSGNNNRLNIEAKVKNKEGDDVYADIYYYWDDDKNFSFKSSHKLGDDTHVKIDGHDDVKKHLNNVYIPDEPGNHYFYVYVKTPSGSDHPDDTDKSNSNNHDEYGKVTVLPRPLPDLVVQSLTVSNSSLSPSQQFTVNAVVINQGNGSSPSTTLRYYRSTNANISRSDTQLATDSVSGLSSNGTSSESATISAPSTPGTYWIGACVDNVNEESDNNNNCSSGIVITVNEPMHPDLIVQSLNVNDSTLDPGQLFRISTGVHNEGNASSSGTTLHYYLSSDSTINSSDIEIGTDSVNALSAGGSSSLDKDNRIAPSTPGTYWIGACIDPVSGESNSGNNCSTGMRITVSNPTYPDLVVQSPRVNNNTLTPGEHFTINLTVLNTGNASSSATTLRYYRSANSIINTNDIEIGTDGVSSLSAGSSSLKDKDNRVAPPTPGTYWIGACIDPVNGESNRGNNCSTGVQITVNNPTYPDLVVPSLSVNSNVLTPGQRFTVYATVFNSGNALSSPSTLRYYQSMDSIISTKDMQLSTESVHSMSAHETLMMNSNIKAPMTTGKYWIGACVDLVKNEINNDNNCTKGIAIIISNSQANSRSNITPIISLLLRPSYLYRADVNRDGIVDTADALLVLRFVNGLDMSSTPWVNGTHTGDVNCSNTVDRHDADLILRFAVGLDMNSTDWCIK